MDAESAKTATENAHLWGQVGAFVAGILGLRGAQWIGNRRSEDLLDEIRSLRASIEAHNERLNEIFTAIAKDLAVLSDRKDR